MELKIELIKHVFKGPFIPFAVPKQRPKAIVKTVILTCVKNKRGLSKLHLSKGDEVELSSAKINMVKHKKRYLDPNSNKEKYESRYISLPPKLMKYFKEMKENEKNKKKT